MGSTFRLALRGLAVIGASLAAVPALANDSTAELATGGLVFVKNPNVTMRSEDLFVSTGQIQVTYRFYNNSDQKVTNLVAFPMPDITFDNPDANIAIPTEDPVNFLGFATTADGAPVATQVEQKAIANGIDQTALLKSLGIPLAPQSPATSKALDALPKDKWQQLINLGLAAIDEYGTTPDLQMQQHLEPRWTLKTTYYWQQTFPPRRELVIRHQYKPSVGASAGSLIGTSLAEDDRDYAAKYCIDSAFVAAATRVQQAAKQNPSRYVSEERIDYILKTGANWDGPIAEFKLTVDKGRPANLVSFCGNGVRKVSPTRFQVDYTNFTPTSDLAVLILVPMTAQ
ncbi:MAG TPA: DUF4424 domain-containing protein [Stellaceae bacterium]|nr:DUF4424 domain-containing protein [Stellaceae bacterium]